MGGSAAFPGLVRAMLAGIFVLFSAAAPAGETTGPEIIATLYPQYDFALRIAGDHAQVRLLLPPGAESHSYEPTPTAMKGIAKADLFIYTGEHMEPWAKRLADSAIAPDGKTAVVDASRGLQLRRHDEDDGDDHGHEAGEENHQHEDAHYHELDPHIWVDPLMAAVMAENIAQALIEKDPANTDDYRRNADALLAELKKLDADFKARVAASPRRTLVFGERFAFAYFFDRYGLEEVGAYKSCAPGVEPGIQAVIATINYVKENKVRYIYLEAMSTSRISKVINQETGAEILAVDSLHNPAPDRQELGYVEIMRQNMDAFARGLE